MNPFWIILILILLALAVPPALAEKSWLRFAAALVLSFASVVLPLFVFFFSAFLLPDWKGACIHGWLDCFILGKLALTPLGLAATAALYSLEVLRVKKRTDRWIVLGIFLGAMISAVCFVFGLTCMGRETGTPWLWLLVPFYVAIWYSVRAVQLVKESKLGLKTCLGAILGSAPFWAASVVWSRSAYASLPDQPPSCFVVTAAGRGHRKLVGPFFEIQRGGRKLPANQQLTTLWDFENLWHKRAPRSHRHFRRFYNRLGPLIAGQIRSPWLADLAFVALKPAECAAELINRCAGKN